MITNQLLAATFTKIHYRMGLWDKIKKIAFEQEDTYNEQEVEASPLVNPYKVAVFDLSNATLEERMQYILMYRSYGEQIQFADKLLQEGPYDLAINMYEQLIERYPMERDKYENGLGQCMLKLDRHIEAISYFKSAAKHGMHPEITEKLIWQASEEYYEKTKDLALVEEYESDFPNGKYIVKAIKLLSPTDDLIFVEQKIHDVPFEVTNPNVVQKISKEINESNNSDNIETIELQNFTSDIENFIEKYFDPSEVSLLFDETKEVPVHIYHIRANDERNFHILMSNGMSNIEMPAPVGAEDYKRAEIITLLPSDWALDEHSLQHENNNWPIRWMRTIARLAIYDQKWFTFGNTFNSNNTTIANTQFTHVALLDSSTLPEDLLSIDILDGKIILYTLIPLLASEAQIKKDKGLEALLEALATKQITDIIDISRV